MIDSRLIDLEKALPPKVRWYHEVFWYFEGLWQNLLGERIFYLKKVWSYAVLLRKDYDFDSSSLYPLIAHKLKRIEVALKEGFALHEKKEMQALRICIRLCERLYKDDHYFRWYDRHEVKWGKLITWTTPTKSLNAVRLNTSRPKAKTDKEKKQERKEFLDLAKKEYEFRARDTKLLFNIITLYIAHWWD